MAIDNQFGKGIGLAAGFDLGAQKPLDSRVAVNTLAERDAHVTENRAYEGMLVYVADTNMTYQLVKGEQEGQLVWKEFGFNKADFDGNFADAIAGVNDKIAQAESDILKINQELGDPKADPSDENPEGVQATGIHKKIDDTAAELRGEIQDAIGSASDAVAGEKAEREAEEARIEGKVDQEVIDRKAADEALGKRIDAANQALADQLNPDKDGSLQKQLNAEIARAQKAESDIQKALDAEEERAGLAEEGLQAAIDAINDVNNGILAQAKAADKVDRDAQLLVDQEQDRRLAALEALHEEGAEVDQKIEAVQDALDEFKEAQEAKNGELDAEDQKLDQAIKDEASRADTEEKRIVGLVEAEVNRAKKAEEQLGKDIEAEFEARQQSDNALQQAIDDEKSRAEGQEAAIRGEMATESARVDQKIADDIATESALRVAEEGKIRQELADAIAKEVDDRDAAILVEKNRAEAAEKVLREDLAQEVQDRKDAVSGEATARANADTALDNRLKVVEASIGEDGALESRVAANEAAIEVINGEGEGSIKQAVADLVNGAPEALDTLDELAAALRDNKDVLSAIETAFDGKLATLQADVDQNEADCDAAIAGEKQRAEGQEAAIRSEFAAADTKLKGELQAEIDADVEVEKLRAEGQEAAIRQEMANEASRVNQKIADDIAAESALRVAEEGKIRQELANEKAALQKEIDDDVKVVDDELAKQKDAAQEGTLANQIKVEKERAIAKENEIAGNLAQELLDRDAADDALDERLQAVEASLGMGEGNEGTVGIASRVEDLEEAIGKAAVPGSDEDPDGEAATGLHKVIDDKIAVLNGEVNNALDGLEKNVAAEKERAEKEEARIAGLVSAEETRAKGEEGRIEGLVTAEAQRAAAAEKENADAIDALELALGAHLTAVSCGDDTAYNDLPSLTPPQA